MSTSEEKAPLIQLHALNGSFILENVHTDESVKTAFIFGENLDVNEQQGINPARGLASEPLVSSSGFGLYATARTIEELQGAVPEMPNLYWWLFTLVSVYREVTFISFTLEQPAVWTVYLETRDKRVYSWMQSYSPNNTPEKINAFVLEGTKELTEQPFMNPSEMMQAFTVTAEHIRMGSQRFVIQTLAESQKFLVSMFDHADQSLRYDVAFGLQLDPEEKEVIH